MRLVWVVLSVVALSACKTAPLVRRPVTLPSSTWPQGTQIHWYDVSGDTEAELRAQLDRLGPETDGERHDAYTTWHVTWHFPFAQSEEGCATGPVTTEVRVVVTLPRWAGVTDERAPLAQRWRRYLDALKEHESGHRLTGIHAASDITEQLPALPAKPTCADAEEAANALARAILEQHRTRDVEYDAETRHGITQGALFP